MQEVQLYISGQRVELFNDETISVTQSIQNIKDPAKIFTDFSKTFSVPFSKQNNKIFKHYYNYDILNSFDARTKVEAEIQLNYQTFKKGYIKLEGVSLKNNKPNNYRITFYGNTTNLKDLIKDDKLGVLTWLSNFDHLYSSANIKSALIGGVNKTVGGVTYTDALVAPLISHTKRLYYDSALPVVGSGNLYYNGSQQGVLWSDLKYSIRLHIIIKAIEEQYGLQFSDDFFSDSNPVWYDLYMWMHRTKGDVESSLTGPPLYTTYVQWGSITWSGGNDPYKVFLGSGSYQVFKQLGDTINSTITLDTLDTDAYNIKLYKDGQIYYEENSVIGSKTFFLDDMDSGYYTLYLESTESVSFTSQTWYWDVTVNYSNYYSGQSTSIIGDINKVFNFSPPQQLPEIKVIDFLTGIFKMFNLTAYVENDIIVVKTLNSFYSSGLEYDISDYVDVSKSSIDAALPYNKINFGYEGVKTFLSDKFNQLTGYNYGELEYTQNNGQFEGSEYNISIPFEKMIYERLTNGSGGPYTDIMFGWMVDNKQEAYINKPLIHYVKQLTSATAISFRDSETTESSLTSYNIPSNARDLDLITLNFKSEINEYDQSVGNVNLFSEYYKDYIQDIFDYRRRIFKIDAVLPIKIFNKIKLNDKLIINGRKFTINNIDTNLQTGESSFELLNEINN